VSLFHRVRPLAVGSARCLSLGLAAALMSGFATGLGACASSGEREPAKPPPAFARAYGPWTPEALDQDVIACLDQARESLTSDPATFALPIEEARLALRDRTVLCMNERGWVER
jgi:hypothetical protein